MDLNTDKSRAASKPASALKSGSDAAETPPQIEGDEITRQLFVRYICSYLLYDYNLSHANSCFYNNERDRDRRAAEKAKSAPQNGRSWGKQLTWAYNQVLSEDAEGLIEHICGEHISRAEYEVMLAEMVNEYMKLPGYGRKEEA